MEDEQIDRGGMRQAGWSVMQQFFPTRAPTRFRSLPVGWERCVFSLHFRLILRPVTQSTTVLNLDLPLAHVLFLFLFSSPSRAVHLHLHSSACRSSSSSTS